MSKNNTRGFQLNNNNNHGDYARLPHLSYSLVGEDIGAELPGPTTTLKCDRCGFVYGEVPVVLLDDQSLKDNTLKALAAARVIHDLRCA